MAQSLTQIIAGLFVFAIPVAIIFVVVHGWLLFREILGSRSTVETRDTQSSEEAGLEYIERHYGKVRID